MATKKEVSTLQDEVLKLTENVSKLEQTILNLEVSVGNLNYKNDQLHSLNGYLADERDRIQRSDNVYKELCTNLMQAIAVLGKHESRRISDEIWHSCRPRQMEAMAMAMDGTENTSNQGEKY